MCLFIHIGLILNNKMTDISIPLEVVPGFKSIAALSKKSVQQIVSYLINTKVSSDPNDFLKGLADFIKNTLKIKGHKDIVVAIASFINLLKEDSYKNVAENLANSFKELHSANISEKDFIILKNNLSQILKACDNLELSVKAFTLKRESVNIYQRSKVVSDIRIIFNKEIDSKDRQAVLVHNLHITYRTNSKNKNFFVALDLNDLKEIQVQIERAIAKDTIIKSDYKDFELL